MTPRGKRILIGILVTMAFLAAIVVSAVVGFVAWVSRPGELIQPERLVSADSTGYAQWTIRLDDPGTEGFLRLLLQATREVPSEVSDSLPPMVDGWLRDAQSAGAERDLERLLPAVVAWTVHPASEGAANLHLLSLSATGLGNQIVLADWIGGFAIGRSRNGSVFPYKEENIYQLRLRSSGPTYTFFARRGAVFATSDVETARQAVDLLSAEEGLAEREPTELERRFAATTAVDPLRGAIGNAHGELADVWAALGGQPLDGGDWGVAQHAAISGGLKADGSFQGVVDLVVADDAARERHAPLVAEAVRQRFAELSVDADIDDSTTGDRIRLGIHIPDLVEAIRARMDDRRDRP